jgi:hypothetical protein
MNVTVQDRNKRSSPARTGAASRRGRDCGNKNSEVKDRMRRGPRYAVLASGRNRKIKQLTDATPPPELGENLNA